jgi:hypothetical protein
LDRIIVALSAWQRGLLERSGRLTLIKSVIMARPIHQILVAEAPAWLLEEINKWPGTSFGLQKSK